MRAMLSIASIPSRSRRMVGTPVNFFVALALVMLAGLLFIHLPIASGSCSNTIYDAYVEATPSSNSGGSFTYTTMPFIPALCGSGWSNGGYFADTSGQFLSATCGSGQYTFIEGDIFFGTDNFGLSSGSSSLNYKYEYSYDNALGQCIDVAADASSGGTIPYAGDNVSILVSPVASGNYYDISWHDYSTAVTLTITNIGVGSRSGPATTVQLETANDGNIGVVYWGTLEYLTTSGTYTHYPTNPSTSKFTNYNMSRPNGYYDDWCSYYTGYSSYC